MLSILRVSLFHVFNQVIAQSEQRAMVEALDRPLGSPHDLADLSVGKILGVLQDQQLLAFLRQVPQRSQQYAPFLFVFGQFVRLVARFTSERFRSDAG